MDIEGRWYNELGSEMNLTVTADGLVSGVYRTAVADRPLPPPRPLAGLCDARPRPGRPQSIAFAVEWGHPESAIGSITAWSGQFQVITDQGKEEQVLVTTWLLTTETERPGAWSSTLVGHDVFTRSRPDPAAVARARALRPQDGRGR